MKKGLIAISLIMGVLLSLQLRSYQKVAELVQRAEPESTFTELRIFQLANKQLRASLEETEAALLEIQSNIAVGTIEEEMRRLHLLSGDVPVQGEGIEISLSKEVEAFWITDLVAQLVATGAEAVAVNDVRLTESTGGFRNVGGGLLMRKDFLRPPFRIMAIGPKKTMKDGVVQTGGIIDRLKNANAELAVLVSARETIIIPSLIDQEKE